MSTLYSSLGEVAVDAVDVRCIAAAAVVLLQFLSILHPFVSVHCIGSSCVDSAAAPPAAAVAVLWCSSDWEILPA
jgi:hypothetical protein